MAIVRFLIKRIVAIILTMSGVIAVAYVMMYYAPGSFFSSSQIASALGQLAVQDPHAYQVTLKMFEERYGLDKPLWEQVLKYIWYSLTFNFGNSYENPNVSIISQLKVALPISLELAFGSVVVALIIGLPLGIIAALKRNSWLDYTLSTLSMTGQAIPAFVLAVLFILLFGVVWPGTLPINGWGTFGNVVLPVLSLAAPNIGTFARFVRGSLIEVLRQDYIRTAQAKGVPYWRMIFRHAIRNSLTALITVVGPTFAFTVVGTVWVEDIFGIPGLGKMLASAFGNLDYPLAITSVYLLCMLVMVTNLIVDLCYAWLDPRVKLE
ncbi:peptide ABC transporter permease [Alicyclobacillus cellulosilyticus]|uniref:Peptide ABC transporter permease n=1 Tax=Alicyclobacillus cellulosilyticus TaxID=1003997 RepID=A0A917K2L3_9BACL|nr:ABC transporter permease [Alicyclobacillus cellulosilyticus]GGI98470.1 peptide ABC transporter permease [Alicyclobacillus cellulosilyticus]